MKAKTFCIRRLWEAQRIEIEDGEPDFHIDKLGIILGCEEQELMTCAFRVQSLW